MTIAGVVDRRVQKQPDRQIFHFRDPENPGLDEYLKYGDLWCRACAVADCLQQYPRRAEVMLVMPLGAPLLICHLGAQLHGGVASIFTHPSEKIRPDVFGANLCNAAKVLRPAVIIASRAYDSHIGDLAGDASTILWWEEMAGSSTFEPKGWHRSRPDEDAIAQYSSGSTGLQKCVTLSHDMVLGQCDAYSRFIGLNPGTDRICSWLPLYHDMGLFTSWLLPLSQGVPTSLMDPFKWVRSPTSLLKLMHDTRGTLCWQPNFAFRLLQGRCSAEEMAQLDLSSVRGMTNCSEPVSAKVMASFQSWFATAGLRRDATWVCYAMAENAFAVTACGGPQEAYRHVRLDREALARNKAVSAAEGSDVASCGIPIEGCEVEIVDDSRAVQQHGTVGEIKIRSPYLMRGYVRNEDLTKTVLDEDGWYYSGDLGFLLDGHLYLNGRKKDLIIVAGRNFYPQDMEECAARCDDAIPGRAVAIGVDDEAQGTQRAVMLVESKLTDPEKMAALGANIRSTIFQALDCQVSEVHIVPHMWLLKTSSGKIARQPNLDRYHQTIGAEKDAAADTPPLPRSLLALEPTLWGVAAAVVLYLYTLFFLLGDSKSWNIYAGF